MSDMHELLKGISEELMLIRYRIEALKETLAEERTADDRRAPSEALEEHKRGETIGLEETLRKLL